MDPSARTRGASRPRTRRRRDPVGVTRPPARAVDRLSPVVVRRRLLGCLASGAAFGAAVSLVNDVSSPTGAIGHLLEGTPAQTAARVATHVLGAGWAWAALAVVAGWTLRTARWAALAGALTAAAASTAYYAADAGLRDEALATYGGELVIWLLASALACPLLGAVGAAAGRPGVPGLLGALAVPAGAALQMLLLPPGLGGPLEPPAEAVWAYWLVWLGAAVSAALVIRRWRAGPSGADAPGG